MNKSRRNFKLYRGAKKETCRQEACLKYEVLFPYVFSDLDDMAQFFPLLFFGKQVALFR